MGVAYIIQGTCGYNFCECATKYMSYNPKRTFLNYSATFGGNVMYIPSLVSFWVC